MPAGLTLDPGTLLLSGTPVENGFFNLVLAFTDANNETYRAPESLFITGGGSTISIGNNRNLGSVAIGVPYSNQLSACCAASLAWSVVDGTLPPGLSLSAGGRLSGAATTPGTYTFLIRAADATNGANYGQRQFTLRVVTGPVLVMVTTSLPFGNMCGAYAKQLEATGGAGPLTWTLAFGSYLPPGLTLASNGLLSGTATGSGQYSFTVIVTDSVGQAATRLFTLAIYPGCGASAAGSAPGAELRDRQHRRARDRVAGVGGHRRLRLEHRGGRAAAGHLAPHG